MAITAEDLDQIVQHIRAHLSEWLAEQSLGKPPIVYEMELRERLVRIEEELKHQREIIRQGFEVTEKRFEEMLGHTSKRFEQVDKRFEQMDRRFEEMTRRLDRFMFWSLGLTVTAAAVVISALRLWLP